LAAKEFTESEPKYKEVIEKVRKLMNCLCSIKTKAKIRNSPKNEKKFCALLPNETRWSGNYLMLKRFKELEDLRPFRGGRIFIIYILLGLSKIVQNNTIRYSF
jgi:hypothetical protein